MKNLIYTAIITLVLVSCKKEAPKDYASFSGTITNQNSDSLIVRSRTYSKKIKVDKDGTFSDTLKVEAGVYNLFDGTESTNIYLKNGFDIHMTIDAKKFDETISYSGTGAEGSNYLAKMYLLQEQEFSDQSMFDLDKEAFENKARDIVNKFNDLLENTKNLDSAFSIQQITQLEGLTEYLTNAYEQNVYLRDVLGRGKESPKFVNYENYKGGTTSLEDLKGKYVYIDVWATWCGPCKAEIPFLQKVEQEYHEKNIEFVSISVDKPDAYGKWKEMIKEKKMGGIQLLADKNFMSDFVTAYKIDGIPRFILIDPQGNIVSADAPRPSSEELKTLLKELNI